MEFKLRRWEANDLASLIENANDPDIAKYMTDGFPFPYTEEHARKFIVKATNGDPISIFAIEVNGKAVGGIGIHPQTDIMRKNAELGYWLGINYQNKGIISRAIPQMIAFAFKTFDITRIYARPFGSNKASQKVLEKCGFLLEARIENNIYKNGKYEDELIYGLRKPLPYTGS